MPQRIAIIGLLLLALPASAQTLRENDWAADEATLREQKLPTKGAALLQIFRDRTPSADIVQQFSKHVARLTAAPYAERVKATADLAKMGPVVRPLLENLLGETKLDAESVHRLKLVLENFPAEKDFAAVSAAARLVQRDRPAGSLPVLFEFAPYATNEAVRQEVQRAIDGAALIDKKPAPIILEHLKDADPARRAAAGEALIRAVGLTAKEKIEPLMKDEHPLVRYQLGLALVEKHDKTALPRLIQTLTGDFPDRAETALDLLYRAAGENAPTESYQGKKEAAAFRAAWQRWFDKHHASLDLAKQLARTDMGFTIIGCMALKAPAQGKIYEIGPAPPTTVRWSIDCSRYPLDIQILGPNRLLVTEYLDRRVTERDFKGNLLWQFPVTLPIAAQRLPNGQTFIVTRQQLLIVDRDGKTVFTHFNQGATITAAQRLRNGQMVVVTSGGRCALLDPQGAELKSFQMGGNIYTMGGNIEVLPNGRILAPLYSQNSLAEYDWNGNKLWQIAINRPVSATRLANGHTLVTCSLDNRVLEIDEQGREVWSHQTDGRPFRARRR